MLANGSVIKILHVLRHGNIQRAPDHSHVRDYLNNLTPEHVIAIELNQQAEQLADMYLEERIVGFKSLIDCQHIATATVHNIEVLVSWNFKHIVNLDKIRLYIL